MKRTVLLEPEAERICNESAVYPRIYQLPPEKGREVLEKIQDTPVIFYSAKVERKDVNTGIWGSIPVYMVQPEQVKTYADVILYLHGAGWVFGSFHTHEKLVRELAARSGCVVIFPEYSRAPEAKYPIAVEQCYSILCQMEMLLRGINLKLTADTITVAGDSAGGNMAVAVSLLTKYRKGPRIQKQLLYYPVTNACFNTKSYCAFGENYYLYREEMIWFWSQYTSSCKERKEITASPLRADIECLRYLPETMILNGEADVLRDEGEDFAVRLRKAGVPVTALRFQAIIHDFVMLNALDKTRACRAAMDVSVEWLKRKNNII